MIAKEMGYDDETVEKYYRIGLLHDVGKVEIPQVARIIAVADSFNAMYSDRQYRAHMEFEKVLSIILTVSGTQLNPEVVDAFFRLVDKGKITADPTNI